MTRLVRIDALRFGRLEGLCTGDLGAGLNVVLGPNESGKSSLTALVRYVLYGFPDKRMKERHYLPTAGTRHGRLAFRDETSEWTLERVDGPHRGKLKVTTVAGADRPGLLDELTRDVSESAFRVVFGFGLDELAEIEQRSGNDIVARLYAAGAGLSVSPVDVRAAIEREAALLFAPGASKPALNALGRHVTETRARIRALEDEADSYARDQQLAHELGERVASLTQHHDESDVRVRALQRDAERSADLIAEVHLATGERATALADIEAAQATLASVDVAADLLAAAPEIEALLDDLGAFRQRLDSSREREAAAREIEDRLAIEYATVPETVGDTFQTIADVDGWIDRLSRAESEREHALRDAEKAEFAAREAERLETTPGSPAAPAMSGPLSWVIAGLGVAGAVVGLALDQIVAVALGVVVAAVALYTALSRRAGAAGAHGAREARPSAEETRRLGATADAERTHANVIVERMADLQAEWCAWAAERALAGAGSDPRAARRLLERFEARDRLQGEAGQRRGEGQRELTEAVRWSERFVALTSPFAGPQAPPELDEIPVRAARMREDLRAARAAAARRDELTSVIRQLEHDVTKAGGRLERTGDEIARLRSRAGLIDSTSADGIAEELLTLLDRESAELTRRAQERDEAVRELHQLTGRLGAEGRAAAMADERLGLEESLERARALGDRYLVLTAASRLMAQAQETYERDQQPEVVRVAERVFADMTGDRYVGLRIPLGGDDITVLDARGGSWTTQALSTGAAQQLYLALRIGLIEQLGDRGLGLPVLMDDILVNFDPERRRGAARAIAALAKTRQVVFFTCHPETAEVLAEVEPGMISLTLDRCSL